MKCFLRALWLVSGISLASCDALRRAFPPDDYFKPVVEAPLQLRDDESIKVTYRHEYEGTYLVQLRFAQPPSLVGRVASPLRLRLNCALDNGRDWEALSSGPYGPFRGHGTGGVILLRYEVPEDLPLKTELTCQVDTVRGDLALVKKYGLPTLLIRNATTL